MTTETTVAAESTPSPASPSPSATSGGGGSGRSKKNKRKSVIVKTEPQQRPSSPSVESDQQLPPKTPGGGGGSSHDGGDYVEEKNPYVEVVAKRLRSLRKRLRNIETTEKVLEREGRSGLNADQLLAIEKKGEIEAVIREMDEMLKQLEAVVLEDAKNRKKERKDYAAEREASIQAAVQDSEANTTQLLVHTVHVFHLYQQQTTGQVEVTEAEQTAVEHLRGQLVTYALEAAVAEAVRLEKARAIAEYAQRLRDGTEEAVHPDSEINYSHIRSLIDRMTNPPPQAEAELEEQGFEPVQEEIEDVIEAVIEVVALPADEQQEQEQEQEQEQDQEPPYTYDDDDIVSHTVQIPPGGLIFRGTSEILDEPQRTPTPPNAAEPAPLDPEEPSNDGYTQEVSDTNIDMTEESNVAENPVTATEPSSTPRWGDQVEEEFQSQQPQPAFQYASGGGGGYRGNYRSGNYRGDYRGYRGDGGYRGGDGYRGRGGYRGRRDSDGWRDGQGGGGGYRGGYNDGGEFRGFRGGRGRPRGGYQGQRGDRGGDRGDRGYRPRAPTQ